MQRLAYDLVNAHQQDESNDKDPLSLIIISVAGLLSATRKDLPNPDLDKTGYLRNSHPRM